MSLFHHSTPANGQLRFFFSPSPQTYLNNTHILSTLFGISDWLSALQFARASIHLVGKLGDMEVPLLFTGDENTTSLFSCFIYAKKHFSGLVNSEKQKEKHGRKEILVRGNPLCSQTKKGALGFHSWRMLNLSNGHREWQLLGAWFPPVEGKKNACSPKLVAFQQVAIKCLHLLDSMLQFPTPIHGFVASTLLACHEFFLYNPTNPKITRSLYF